MKRLLLVVLVLLLAAVPLIADQAPAKEATTAAPSEDESAAEKNRRRLAEWADSRKSADPNGTGTPEADADPMLPLAPAPSALEGATKAKYEEALREYYDYHISGLRHRSKVFAWQLFSSRLIFVAVLLLVVAGIYFAAVQFHATLQRSLDGESNGDGEVATEFSASAQGIKVSSPVLGVVILVISLAFFYFYLVYVYPIENIF